MSVADQARAFLSMALCGGVLGAVYDALGMLRRGAWLTALADLCFGLCAAGGVIVTALFLEAEPFRLYVPLGAALGFAVMMTLDVALG